MRSRLTAEHGLLALLLVAGVVPLAILLAEAVGDHGSITGATGIYPADQLQYLAWIRDAGGHGLAASGWPRSSAR
jgi:hypothetical protein